MTQTERPGAARYAELLRDAPYTGRCPVILARDDVASIDDRRVVDPAAIDPLDANAVLTGWWPGGPCREDCPCEGETTGAMPDDPAGPSFPDLSRDPDTIDAAACSVGAPDRMVIVGAARPADIPGAIGWAGIVNHEPYRDLAGLCAVLRRWESRWGAVLVAVEYSRVRLSVAYPPRGTDECLRAAAEHFAFCPDQRAPRDGTFHTLGAYARTIRGATSWTFWWD